VFAHWGITKDLWSYNGQDNYYQLYNKSRVYLLDAKYLPSDPEYYRFGSMQMTRGMIEEAGEFELACKNNLAASLGRWKNDVYNLPLKLLQTCNPAKNYLYKDYYLKHKQGNLESWKKFIQAFPSDNKRLPDGYLENLERTLSPNEKERLLYGNWEYDDDPAALIDYNKILDIFSNTHVPPGEKKITVDVARFGGDKVVIIEWDGWRGKVKSYQRQGLEVTTTYIEGSRMRMGVGKSDIIVDEDGVGGGIVDFYGCQGFQNGSRAIANPDGGYQENFDNLKSQCYFRLAERINKNGLYLQCDSEETKKLIIEELEQVKQKHVDSDMKKGVIKKEDVKAIIGRSPDFSDAIMMREFFELTPKTVWEWA